ncbi:hypothetical protein [Zeaxanthinibacter enoshimensis]|uniref:Uncharacterized protein n=1 Tax=Zeaxanthinibacter enoshimensis TaxID=392009 RepID=A0A4V3D423_9FLAO|nr:hypothetical protein [Zeaxanthinibacter enoshimensis]TDQ32651.1 hypothetical protein CLV82_0484 [Zeaxanthinibacter enoshimensis]
MNSRQFLVMICLMLLSVSCYIFFIRGIVVPEEEDFSEVISTASVTEEEQTEIDMYLDKFYRDCNNAGLFPVRPPKIVIAFANFDNYKGTTHMHGFSLGFQQDDFIEIYINRTSWAKFNKQQRYYLMYHELAHDVLNLDDLEEDPQYYKHLMYPVISAYDQLSMDDFIENSRASFEELAAEQTFYQ